MLKLSGPGRVVRSPRAPTGGLRAALVNFDVDGDALKVEHKVFLDGQVVPILRQGDSICFLRGEASHTGSDAHNLELSQRRAENVRAFLTSRGVVRARIRAEFAGESVAGSFPGEKAEARAVSLLVARTAPLPRANPQPLPKPAPTTTQFKVRLLGGLSRGIGPAQVEMLFFQVWAPSLSVTTFYEYLSGGFGKGKGVALSATLKGPFNDFATSAPIATTDFGGAARYTTSSAGPFSVNFLNFMGFPPGVKTIPNPLKIETGFTVGIGLSSSVGSMNRGFTGPFSGP